ncbi:MAG: RHS repeat-associated core domain-containing protein, partial [candidate division Zixibacteria bacterium]|nr:RHS repeat-associated core domain-containing protein [candidate division Zixibacteria bacterium]
RYYSAELGRFLSRDPIGYRGGMNLYAYVGNNSVNLIDPLGLCGEKPWWENLEEGYYYGTGYGQTALEWYAQRYSETGNPFYAAGGGIAALWTPETYQQTGWTLVGGYSVEKFSQQPRDTKAKIINTIADQLTGSDPLPEPYISPPSGPPVVEGPLIPGGF